MKTAKIMAGILALMAVPFVFLGWPSAALVSSLIWLLAQTAGLLRISRIG